MPTTEGVTVAPDAITRLSGEDNEARDVLVGDLASISTYLSRGLRTGMGPRVSVDAGFVALAPAVAAGTVPAQVEPPPSAAGALHGDAGDLGMRSLPRQRGQHDPASMPRVSVVIPTLNEAANLPDVFARLPEGLHQVVVVDGGSSDNTVAVARVLRPDVLVVQQNRRGKGNAIVCGFAVATGDIIVMLDADGSADPAEIEVFVAALCRGADYVKGTRFAGAGGSADITCLRRWGNWTLNTLVNFVFRTHYTDLCYGYNAFWRRCLPSLGLHPGGPLNELRWGDGFEIETILNIRAATAGLKVEEVASFEHPRLHGESNLDPFADGLRVLKAILLERVAGPPAPALAPQSVHRAPTRCAPLLIDLTTGVAGRHEWVTDGEAVSL